MGFNYGKEKRKFDAAWEKTAAWYRAEGMSEEAIAEMREFDLAVFRSDRVYATHTQPLPNQDSSQSKSDQQYLKLTRKFPSMATDIDDYAFKGRFDWIETLDNEELVLKLRQLSLEDLELVTMIVFDGLTHSEIADLRGCTRSNVSKKWTQIKKSLE